MSVFFILTVSENNADSLRLDHDARDDLDSIIAPCCKDVRELKSGHHHKIVEITDHAGKSLLTEYRVRILIGLGMNFKMAALDTETC